MTDETTPPAVTPPDAGAVPTGADEVTEDLVKLALRRVKDPDLNLNIVDLGLVYSIHVEGTSVTVEMSLTSPACPSGPELLHDATTQVQEIPGVTNATVNIVWSPPWTPDRIEPRVRTYLGF